jgi:transcriptional regulator with XRE-family HTH domain/Holliday junction resolvasome RuvABC endonuclease subunit
MASHHLSNHLRKYRKRSALSQGEVAYLLGVQSNSKVCRYERFTREPSLHTALAYEAVFQRPISELFPGLFETIRKKVKARAKKLEQKEFHGSAIRFAPRKRQTLAKITAVKPKKKIESIMARSNSKHGRVLGIAPSTRGFGFAIMEGDNILVDWGVKAVKGDKNARSLSNVAGLIAQYKPNAIVLENTHAPGSRRSSRVQALIQEIVSLAENEKIKVERFSRKQLNRAFTKEEQGSKHTLAKYVAARFPEELGFRLPPKRRIWMNQDYRIDIFEAVALAGHYLQCRGRH